MAKASKAPAVERRVVINGKHYLVGGPIAGRIKPGLLARETRNRNAWRVICLDGDEVILRSMRSAGIFEAVPEDEFREYYRKLTPET